MIEEEKEKEKEQEDEEEDEEEGFVLVVYGGRSAGRRDEAIFWLKNVLRIGDQIIWEKMKHKARNIEYYRKGDIEYRKNLLSTYDPICETGGNEVFCYEVKDEDLAEAFAEQLAKVTKYWGMPTIETTRNFVLLAEKDGRLILVEPYKEYQLLYMIKRVWGRKYCLHNSGTLLIIKDLATGENLLIEAIYESIAFQDFYPSLVEQYEVEVDELMEIALISICRALDRDQTFGASFYEKHKNDPVKELTLDELPDWYSRDEDDLLVKKASDMGLDMQKEWHTYFLYHAYYHPERGIGFTGDVRMLRRFFLFGDDILEIRRYEFTYHIDYTATWDDIKYSFVLYLNGYRCNNFDSLSASVVKL